MSVPSVPTPQEPGQESLPMTVDRGAAVENPADPPPIRASGAQPIEETIVVVAHRGWLMRWVQRLASALEWLFGLVSLCVGLAVLATLPVLQLLSLGYLLEASGRVSRSGRIRDGFVGIRKAARVGSIVAGTWLCLLPARLVSDFWYSSNLIAPRSPETRTWQTALVLLTIATVAHISWAWYRGGRLRHFLWPAPIRFVRRMLRGGKYVEARDAFWQFLVSLRLPYYFWLGLRGFAGAVAWLFIPILLFIGATTLPPGPAVLSGLLGGLLLMAVLVPLPFLQAEFAAERRMVAMFGLRRIMRLFWRSPLAFLFALFITLLFALPLYLLKIEATPEQVTWVASLVFVAFIFPARLLTGWAVGLARHTRNARPTWWRLLRCGIAFVLAVPVSGSYVFIVFFTRYTSWHGVWSLFEQHAFLVPVPFLGL